MRQLAIAASLLLSVYNLCVAQTTALPQDRIIGAIDEAVKVPLAASVPAAVAQATSSAPVDPAFAMSHMILALQPSATQQAALTQLIAQQSDPTSVNYHKFLSPAQFAASFGASSTDVSRVTAWLESKGFQVEQVTPGRLAVVFSGTASQVNSAFSTEIRQYVVNGETHHANASAAQIPVALAGVVSGPVKLHDFHSQSSLVKPLATYGSSHFLAPADYATIYDLSPLYTANVNGTGQSIAVIGRSNVLMTDIADFRSQYGLPASAPTVVLATGYDPGFTSDGDALEATLDVSWAGAVAPNATIQLVIAASTASTDGIDLAAQYAINHSVAPVLSVSFGSCEAVTNNSFYNMLWQQAAAQGITVFVSAGDSGAAGCQNPTAPNGTVRAVNGLCSSPFSTCVGGTEFNEGTNPGQYWLSGNNSVMGSAISYIPEKVWNESGNVTGGSDVYAGGGGSSSVYAKPAWQTGLGVPTNQQRDVPDVSMTAAVHDGYLLMYNGSLASAAGTSASTPAMAGIMALVVQKYGSQGLANPNFYSLAAAQVAGGPAAFHDITVGNNGVPQLLGFAATPGYDEATGLGSVDAAVLVNNWNSVPAKFTLTLSGSAIPATPAQPGAVTITATPAGNFNATLALSFSTLPSGITASFGTTSIAAGNGSSVLTFTIAKTARSGTYPVTVTATGGGQTKAATFDLDVTVATSCTLTATPTSLTMVKGQGSSTNVICGNAAGLFPTNLALSVSGLASGMTASFSPATLLAGAGLSKLTVFSNSTVTAGSYTLTVTATLPNASPAFSQTLNVPVTVNAPTTFTLTPSVNSVSFLQGAASSFTVTSAPSGAFNAAIRFSLSGFPTGVTATLSSNTVAAPGNGVIMVSIQSLIATVPGTYTGIVTGVSGGLSITAPVKLIVSLAPTFVLTETQKTLTVRNNATAATIGLNVGTLANGFNSAVTFAAAGLPNGVAAAFTPASLAAPGSGSTVVSFSALSTATTGVATVSLTATGGTLVRTVLLQITVTPMPTFTLTASLPSDNLVAGDAVKEVMTATGLYGYSSAVAMSTSALPAGVSVTFSASSISGAHGTTTMTVQTLSTLAPGTYSIVVVGTDAVNNIAQSATINLLVGTLTTTLSPTSVSVLLSGSAATTITTVGTSYTGNVYFYMANMPVGLSVTFSSQNLAGSGTSTLTVHAASTMKPGTYMVSLHTQTGGVFSLTPLTVVVQ